MGRLEWQFLNHSFEQFEVSRPWSLITEISESGWANTWPRQPAFVAIR
jgi:hypothetical protein